MECVKGHGHIWCDTKCFVSNVFTCCLFTGSTGKGGWSIAKSALLLSSGNSSKNRDRTGAPAKQSPVNEASAENETSRQSGGRKASFKNAMGGAAKHAGDVASNAVRVAAETAIGTAVGEAIRKSMSGGEAPAPAAAAPAAPAVAAPGTQLEVQGRPSQRRASWNHYQPAGRGSASSSACTTAPLMVTLSATVALVLRL